MIVFVWLIYVAHLMRFVWTPALADTALITAIDHRFVRKARRDSRNREFFESVAPATPRAPRPGARRLPARFR